MKRCLQLFAALVLLVVVASNAHATQTQTTLKVLIDNGWNIVAGDKRFDRFSFSGGALPENFLVTALPDGGLDPGPGLRFNVLNDALEVFDDDSRSVTIGYRVTVLDPGLWIKDVSMTLTGYVADGQEDQASVQVSELVGTTSGGNDLANISVHAFDPGPDLLASSANFSGRSEIWVQNDILVNAWDDFDYARLDSFEQRFSQEPIPEPLTAGLGMMGLAALALAATRRRVA